MSHLLREASIPRCEAPRSRHSHTHELDVAIHGPAVTLSNVTRSGPIFSAPSSFRCRRARSATANYTLCCVNLGLQLRSPSLYAPQRDLLLSRCNSSTKRRLRLHARPEKSHNLTPINDDLGDAETGLLKVRRFGVTDS